MVLHGDSLQVLKELPDNSIDSVVSDPPYGLAFMGKKWDYDVPSVELWREVLRVLKPGGHLLSFGGTRTYHRMVVAIEDAGFEIRDQIMWIYGSGFPKSMNIKEGEMKGWGTALKPANEPIVLARKPLEKGLTVAENVLKWGTGALNIDGTRIGLGGRWPANVLFDEEAAKALDEQSGILKNGGGNANSKKGGGFDRQSPIKNPTKFAGDSGGASRFFYVAKASKRERNAGLDECDHNECDHVCTLKPQKTKQGNRPGSPDMTGKFPDHDHRPSGGNNHPTVKPVKLMEYLIKLICPPNGIVLDPFMGSGTTGVAAINLGFEVLGIEREAEYITIAEKRMENARNNKGEDYGQDEDTEAVS